MKMTIRIVILILLSITKIGFSQTVVQSVRGLVFDNETQTPLIGATVVITGTKPLLGASTDLTGSYKISNVPLGRYNIQIRYIGYDPAIVSGILVTSADYHYEKLSLESEYLLICIYAFNKTTYSSRWK